MLAIGFAMGALTTAFVILGTLYWFSKVNSA